MTDPHYPHQLWRGRSAIAIAVIAVGVVVLAGQIFDFRIGNVLWPLFMLVPGLVFLWGAFSGTGPVRLWLAIPGTIITTTGLIFVYQVITDHFESWAYAWALYPAAIGLMLIAVGRRNGDESQVRNGRELMRWGLIAFIVMLAAFELLIFDGGNFMGWVIGLALVGGGGYLLWQEMQRRDAAYAGAGVIITPPPPAPPPSYSGPPPTGPIAPSSPPTQPSVPPRPAVATEEPAPEPSVPSIPAEPFPADELPEPPPAPDAPFPADDQTTDAPAATGKPRTTARRSTRKPAPGTDTPSGV